MEAACYNKFWGTKIVLYSIILPKMFIPTIIQKSRAEGTPYNYEISYIFILTNLTNILF
jgi:hypothetical protein